MTEISAQTMFNDLPELLTIERFADACSVCARSIRREIERGNLRAVRIGRSVRIPRTELVRLARLAEGAPDNNG